MGYTHYWKVSKDIPETTWKLIARDARKVMHESSSILSSERGEKVVNASKIHFEGIGENAHETFLLLRTQVDFDFCKTAQKPYDVVVCAVLAIAFEHAPDYIKPSSDGKCEDWQAGVDLCASSGVKISDYTAERLRDLLGSYNPEPAIERPSNWP